ncbi:MAG: glycosyltransferase family 1 protein [Acidobacteria bacterium]|nr:MAG: glycosyltransferase family 1 protein [Acidobacteriota bacterium]
MRIALFCHKFWPDVGGLCTYTGRLAEYLAAHGHDVRVFTTTLAREGSCEQVAPNLVVRRFTTALANHPPYYFSPGLLTASALRTLHDVDVVHSVGYYFFGTVFAHATAAYRDRPHVATPVYTLNPTTWQRRSFDAVVGRRLVRHAAHVIPQSAHEADLLRAARFELRSSTIVPFGVDSEFFEHDYDVEDLRERHGIAPREQVLLFVGKVMSPKGAFDALEVVARLRADGRKLRLVMIGDVHARETDLFAARVRELGLQQAVILPGAVTDRREISRYYQLSDAVLFPSQYEQFGIVAVEAAASGRPLLGTPVGIMQTLVPQYEFGLLHRFGDIDGFQRNLVEVLESPRYRENAKKHRQEILAGYDWRRIAMQTEDIYRRTTRQTGD